MILCAKKGAKARLGSCVNTGTCVPSAQVTVGGSSLKSAKLILQGRGLFSFKSHRLKNVRLGCGTFADLTWPELLVYTVPC